MKRTISMLLLVFLLFIGGCTATDSEGAQEATAIEGGVRIALYENRALPYRWSITIDSDAVYLDTDESDRGFDFPFAAGEAPANRVFTLRFAHDGSARVSLSCARIEPEDANDTIDERKYRIEKNGDSITIVLEAAGE